VPPTMPARIGERSSAPRVLSERITADGYTVSLEGIAGRSYVFRLKTPAGERSETLTFPATAANADGYTSRVVTYK